MSGAQSEPADTPAGVYPTTIWSEVQRAGKPESEEGLAALGAVLGRYYLALRRHLSVKFQVTDDQAEDWLQEFLHRKVLLGKLLVKADRDRGKFRTFLLNSLDHHVFDELRGQHREKRMPPGGPPVPIDGENEEVGGFRQDAGGRFETEWAHAIVEQTLARMREECQEKGESRRWEVFKARVLDTIMEGADPIDYDELRKRYHFQSPPEAANALVTAKRMFHRLLRQVISEYVGEGEDVEAEIRELRRILAS